MNADKAYWSPLWHIYQPPIQTREWLFKVTEESYRKIIQLYSEFPEAKFTLNINASLTQLLMENELWDVIEGFKLLAENGQMEFVSTPSFHVICPLLPQKEVMRQIRLNDKINRKAFGKAYNPTGVWLPEMAYSPKVIPAIVKCGYKWIPLAGVASNGKWSNKGYFIVKHGKYKLKVIFRDDIVSINIGFGKPDGNFVNELRMRPGTFCFTALDGETIGHHVKEMVNGMRSTLKRISENEAVETLKCGDIFRMFDCLGDVDALPSSWSTSYEDIKSGNYFPLWKEKFEEPFRTVHELAWKHLHLLIHAAERVENRVNGDKTLKRIFEEARDLVNKGQHSCMYWWFTRDDWHRVPVRFLVGLEIQARAFSKLQQVSKNDKKIMDMVERANSIRDRIYREMNNFYYFKER